MGLADQAVDPPNLRRRPLGRVLGVESLQVRLKGLPGGAGVEALAELRIGADLPDLVALVLGAEP